MSHDSTFHGMATESLLHPVKLSEPFILLKPNILRQYKWTAM